MVSLRSSTTSQLGHWPFPTYNTLESDWLLLSLSTGSIFVDCGSTVTYVDNITGIPWMPDDNFFDKDAGVNVGVNADVPHATQYYPHFSELTTVRYFRDHRIKNCYKFPVIDREHDLSAQRDFLLWLL